MGEGRRGIGWQEQYHRQGETTGPSAEKQKGVWVSCKTGGSKTQQHDWVLLSNERCTGVVLRFLRATGVGKVKGGALSECRVLPPFPFFSFQSCHFLFLSYRYAAGVWMPWGSQAGIRISFLPIFFHVLGLGVAC